MESRQQMEPMQQRGGRLQVRICRLWSLPVGFLCGGGCIIIYMCLLLLNTKNIHTSFCNLVIELVGTVFKHFIPYLPHTQTLLFTHRDGSEQV